ncbi:cupin domain-containing protein [Stigmatella aurantiaca]|uniref:Cupin domain protein n=1 Tax=Stigmatella aurantiaca (strain DW4/3-1) TaxID=378806 RepID=Q08XU8_STIAD|nr:cupin domain-containing protein [Stigmatella aurantiaca]ADO74459.1 Cupin domain protein [Stigmatella aurantiaca DW4/3-1]EAU65323.1 cupin region [Stigmatella aurantiaca DW4/3-1]
MPSPHLIHEAELPWTDVTHGSRIALRRKQLGAAAKGQNLGCSLIELLPGKQSWPRHYHLANEEAIYVLSGEGHLRLGEETLPLKAGDYVALPASPTAAHQLFNGGTEPLRYLAFSTMTAPDIVVYPDSKKVGVFGGAAPGGNKAARVLHAYFPLSAEVDYWSGEDTGAEEPPTGG